MSSWLSDNEILNLESPTGRTYRQEMISAAKRLKWCIQQRIDEAYLTSPKIYKRTYGLHNSLDVDNHITVVSDGKTLRIEIGFDNGMMRPSVMKNHQGKNVNVMKLLNYGFRHRDSSPLRRVKYFGWRRGAHFIEKGIADFNTNNPLGMKIDYSSIEQTKNDYYN